MEGTIRNHWLYLVIDMSRHIVVGLNLVFAFDERKIYAVKFHHSGVQVYGNLTGQKLTSCHRQPTVVNYFIKKSTFLWNTLLQTRLTNKNLPSCIR